MLCSMSGTVDMRPQYFLGGAKQAQQQAASPKAAAQSVTNDASGALWAL